MLGGENGALRADRLRGMAVRLRSRWVLAALGLDVVLAVVDASLGHSRILTTSYLIPALLVALFATGEQAALVAVVSLLLAVGSGAWHDYLFTGPHLYRVGIVLAGGAIGVAGAVLRSGAVDARDRMALLGEVSRIADGRRDITEALARLAQLLVPAIADCCAIVGLEPDLAPAIVARCAGNNGDLEGRLSEWLSQPRGAELLRQGRDMGASRLMRRLDRSVADTADRVLIDELRLRSALIVPMRAGETTFAVLVLASGYTRRPYGVTDRRFADTLASRAALALQNARLLSELLEARQRMDAVLGSLADPVTIRDRSGRVVYANDAAVLQMGFSSPAEMLEREPEALFGQYIVADEHGEPLEMDRLPSIRLLQGEEPAPLTLRVVDPRRGEERWQVLKATPLRDRDGNVEAAVTIIEDITASKRAELQTSFLARAGEILASSLEYEETLRNVAWLAVPEIADWCAVDLIGEEGARQRVVIAHRDPAKLELAQRLRDYDEEPDRDGRERGVAAVMRTGESELVSDIPPETLRAAARDEEHLSLIQQLGMRSGLVVPLRTGVRIVGAMTLVNSDSGRRFTEEDVQFAEQIGIRAAVAVENARLYTQRSQIAMTLQQSLLPEALPQIEGWEVASLYRPASVGGAVEVGGDFYDAFGTDRGWIMLIGDVTGKGVEAAAMTSLVRHGARFVGEDNPDPAQILSRLDLALRQQPALSLCSALCLRIERARICLASAGHPLPLIVTDDGVRTIGSSGSVLGAFADGEWPTTEFVMRPDEVLLLYTDGVTDTVGSSGRFGEQRLHQTMAECGPLAVADLLRCLDTNLSGFQVGPQADDTAALALRRAAQRIAAAQGGERRRAA